MELENEKKDRLLRAAELTETKVSKADRKDEIAAALRANDVDEEYYVSFVLPQIEQEEAAAERAEEEEKARLENEGGSVLTGSRGVVTSETLKANELAADSLNGNTTEPAVEDAKLPGSTDQYIVKFTGTSAHYEIGKYVFTKSHPYAVVDANDVEWITSRKLFRVAFPQEVEEYYS